MKDILSEIMKYLLFEDRIILYRSYGKEYYDIGNKYIYDMIDNDFEYGWYGECVDSMYDYLRDKYIKLNLTDESDEEMSDDSSWYYYVDDKEDILSDKLKDIIQSSLYNVYIRKVVEIKDYYGLKFNKIMLFDNEFEETLPIDIWNEISDYYEKIMENNIVMDLVCNRCGKIGHHDTSKECIFYNKKFEKKIIKKEILGCINDIIKQIIKDDKEEKRQKKLELLKCIICKIHHKASKCINMRCSRCCNDDKCIRHKGKYKRRKK
jgi:hypothetical protein